MVLGAEREARKKMNKTDFCYNRNCTGLIFEMKTFPFIDLRRLFSLAHM